MLLAWTLTGCRKTVSPPPSPAIRQIVHALQEAYRRGERPRALALADSLIHLAPRDASGYLWKGILLREIGQLQSAAEMLETAHQLAPEQVEPLLLLGRILQQQGHFRQAIVYYRQATRRTTGTLLAAAWLQMGYAYHKQGIRDSAQWAFMHALRVDSTLAEAWDGLRQLREEEGELEQALTAARKAVRLAPGEVNYHLARGHLLLKTGAYAAAIEDFQYVLSQRPWHRSAHYALSRAYQALGQHEEAQRHRTLAESLQRLEPLLTQAEVSATDHPQALSLIKLARRLLAEGYATSTQDALEAARMILPDNEPLQKTLQRIEELPQDNLPSAHTTD